MRELEANCLTGIVDNYTKEEIRSHVESIIEDRYDLLILLGSEIVGAVSDTSLEESGFVF